MTRAWDEAAAARAYAQGHWTRETLADRLQQAATRTPATARRRTRTATGVLDLTLPDSESLHTLKSIEDRAPDIPVVVLSGHTDEELALAVVREQVEREVRQVDRRVDRGGHAGHHRDDDGLDPIEDRANLGHRAVLMIEHAHADDY